MTKGPATEEALGDLHNKVAKVMTNALDKVITAQENPVTGEDGEPVEVPVNPALLSVVTKFLAENKITCAPQEGNAMSDLEKKLAAKKQTRRKVVGNVVHLEQDD